MKTSRHLLRHFLALTMLAAPATWADVKLPAIISDHMVLQQDTPANVWGWAEPGEKVTVQLGGKSVEVVTGPDGKWNTRLEGLQPGAIGEMKISGKNSLTINDVAVGEVWVCSGQSNMEFKVAGGLNAKDEAEAAQYPLIRMFTVQKAAKAEPQTDCVGTWEVCSPETVPRFSAVGYFFGRKLHLSLKQPIGLIHTSWGGTPAEFWTPRPVLDADPEFKPIAEAWDRTVAAYPQAKAEYDKAFDAWQEAKKKADADGTKPPQPPRTPRGGDATGSPAGLYNGMIAPLLPYTIRGATWYQGESNAGNAKQYRRLFPSMILSWREAWGLGEFPFLFVQLANFKPRFEMPTDSQWAELREAQLMTLELPHTGMAVAIDVGEANDIHPKNKQEVGRRLALVAEATVYYIDHEYSGPIYTGAQPEEGKIRVSFRHAEGMKAANGGKLKGFAVAGEDRKWTWADAEIQGDHVLVKSASVPQPVAVRYAWADNPECNLLNGAELPASPFRSDDWPQSPTPPAPAPAAAAKAPAAAKAAPALNAPGAPALPQTPRAAEPLAVPAK